MLTNGFLLLFLPHKALLMAHGKRSPGKVSLPGYKFLKSLLEAFIARSQPCNAASRLPTQ
jgi:hypothetical protein